MQEVALPAEGFNVPIGHNSQRVLAAFRIFPTLQENDVVVQSAPSGQISHALFPVVLLYVPVGQAEHAVLSAFGSNPALQVNVVAADAGQEAPVGQERQFELPDNGL